MSSGIEVGDRMILGDGKPAWHSFGIVKEGALTAEDALGEVGKETYSQVPIFLGNGNVIPDRLAVVRDSDSKVYYVSSEHYKIYQPKECFAFMDDLLGEGVTYSVAGTLHNGAKLFLVAHMPNDIVVAGDEIKSYVTLIQSYDGKSPLLGCDTNERVVCRNTMNIALGEAKEAKRLWKSRHMGTLESKVDNAREFFRWNKVRMEAVKVEAERLLTIKLTDTHYVGLVDALLPITESMTERMTKATQERRSILWQAIDKPDLENFRNTAWGFVNAVADYVDHAPPVKKTATFEQNRFLEVALGSELLDQAHKLVLALTP